MELQREPEIHSVFSQPISEKFRDLVSEEPRKEKLFAFGELHSWNSKRTDELMNSLREAIRKEKPTHVVCTGDFDHPSMVIAWEKLEKELKNKGIAVITTPGNHDFDLVGEKQGSASFRVGGNQRSDSLSTLQREYEKMPGAKEYLRKLFENYSGALELSFAGKKLRIVHGIDSNNAKESTEGRLYSKGIPKKEEHEEAHDGLQKKNAEILLRGHDHLQAVSSRKNNSLDYKVRGANGESPHSLEGETHVITNGLFYDGKYAVLTAENNKLLLKFKRAFS